MPKGFAVRVRIDRGAVPTLTPLEILNCLLVFLGRSFRLECAEISSFTRFRILLSRVQPILTGLQFSDHEVNCLCPRALHSNPPDLAALDQGRGSGA